MSWLLYTEEEDEKVGVVLVLEEEKRVALILAFNPENHFQHFNKHIPHWSVLPDGWQ